MAAIGYIQRVLMPLVIVLVMVSILAFLMMDSQGPGGGGFGGGADRLEFAKINGEPINKADYDSEVNVAFSKHLAFQGQVTQYFNRQYIIEPQQDFQLREQAWTSYLNEKIMGDRLAKAGLAVSEQEYADLVFGPEPHPYIAALYQGYLGQQNGYDPNNPDAMRNFVNLVSDQAQWQNNPAYAQAYYDYVAREHEMRRQVKYDKYINLLQKSSYTPSWMAKEDYDRGSAKRKVSFVKIPYTDIPDTDVDITNEAELLALYREKINNFTPLEERRGIEYVSFPITATSADTQAILTKNTNLLAKFQEAASDSSFLALYSEGDERFNRIYRTQDDLYNLFVDSTVAESIYNMDVSSYYGPFYEPGVYRSVKLSERSLLPDSTNLRQILVLKNPEDETFNAMDTVNAIMARLAEGEDFAELAKAYSADQSAANGGELGWATPNSGFIGLFRDFYLGNPELNAPQILEQEYGFHIVEATERKNMQEYVVIQQLNTSVVPSRETIAAANKLANDFFDQYASSDELFDEGISTMGLNKRVSPLYSQNDFSIPGVPNSRDVITWTYTSEDQFNFYDKDDRLLVVKKGAIQEAGPPPMADVRTQLESDLRRKKKAEMLMDKAKAASGDINAIATSLGGTVQTTEAVNLSSSSDPNMGPEPYVIGASFGLGLNEVSEPIEGITGIFFVSPTEDIPAVETEDYSINATRLNTQLSNRFSLNSIVELSKKSMDIEDNRYRF